MPCQNDVIYINTFQLTVLVVGQPTQNVLYIHQLCVCVCVCTCVRVCMCVCVMTTTCTKTGWQDPIQIGGPPRSPA